MAYQCKGLYKSKIVCEYEVNLSTNEKVITEKQNWKQTVKEQCWISRSSEGQGHSYMLVRRSWPKQHCVYEVNPLTNDKVITEIPNLKVKC